jgi:hypothetical protein
MKKFSEAVLAPHKHMSKKASPYHAHSKALVYTPSGKEEIRPIDIADAGYGGEAVADAEGGEADAGRASKRAVSPMKMQTLVKKTTNEETERERLLKLRSFTAKNRKEGLGKAMVEEASPMIKPPTSNIFYKKSDAFAHAKKHGGKVQKRIYTNSLTGHQSISYQVKEDIEQVDELKKSTLASYAKKAADEVSYHSFTAGTMSPKDPERLETDKKAMKRQRGVERAVDKLAKEEVEQIDEMDKSQPSSSRGAEGLATGNKATPVTAKKAAADALKLLKKNVKPVKEEVELDEAGYQLVAKTKENETFKSKVHPTKSAAQGAHYKMSKSGGYKEVKLMKVDEENVLDERNMENKAKKDNVTRQIGTAAYIQHGADAGSAKMTGRKVMSDPKMKSKKVADLYRKLPNIKEASSNGPEEENDMAMTQLHFIKYAAEEIMEAIKVGTDMEEWYQNKLTKAHMIMEGLHSYMEGRKRHYGSLGDPVYEGKMKDIATNKAEDERLAKLKAMAKKPQPKVAPVPRVGPMEKALEEQEVWDKPMPDSKKQGSLSPEQKAKAKARAERAGRSYPNMIDNMWASKQ